MVSDVGNINRAYLPMIIIYQILNAIICGGMAAIDADRIANSQKVNHFLNGCIHFAIAIGAGFIFDWKIGVAILFESKIAFDIALNIFRDDKPIDYTPSKPDSMLDKLENKIFGKNFFLAKGIYLIISVILNFI